jgi:LacI family transcriptional regulator
MRPALRVALLSANWTRWEHRLLSGGLRYADAHPRLVIRPFAPFKDLPATLRELREWGAQGIFGILEDGDLRAAIKGLKPPVPIVNCALAGEYPDVVTVLGDISAFLDTALGHLRHLGLRSFGMLLVEDAPGLRERLLNPFLETVKPARPADAGLIVAIDRAVVWAPEAEVRPVPPKLVEWLKQLPKPVGILCPHLGGGGYLIRVCRALKLRVPEDVAVVGSDDVDLSLAIEPTLTSVVLTMDLVGFEAVKVLSGMMGGKKPAISTIRLKSAELTVRESTGLRRPEICDIGAALRCIHDEACRGISVGQVIKQTQSVSKVTFYRRFQAAVGKSPAEAIQDRKLDEVRRLLTSTDLPLNMVSDLCGFSSTKVLARVFRTVEATTPREFRKSQTPAKPGTARSSRDRFASHTR